MIALSLKIDILFCLFSNYQPLNVARPPEGPLDIGLDEARTWGWTVVGYENRLEAGVCFLRPVRCAQLRTLDSESNMVLPTSCGNCCKLNSQMSLKIINLLDRKLNKRHPVIRNHPAA